MFLRTAHVPLPCFPLSRNQECSILLLLEPGEIQGPPFLGFPREVDAAPRHAIRRLPRGATVLNGETHPRGAVR